MVQDDEILAEFLLESQENLARLDEEIVLLERDPSSGPLLGSVFRTIHTIKGTCGFLGFSRLETLSHRAENLLSEVRGGDQSLTPPIVTAILGAVDAIKGELAIIRETGAESERTQTDLLALLESLSCAGKKLETAALPEPEPLAEKAAGAPVPMEEVAEIPEIVVTAAPPQSGSLTDKKVNAAAPPADTTVRLDIAFLDRLVNLVGELVLARNEIAKLSARGEKPYQASSQRLDGITTELQANIMRTRMQPVGSAWGKIPRIVRDLSKVCGKEIRLEMKGAETELDRAVVDAIRDPLIHIVRNSCDHGIESPHIRLEQGKDPEGTILLRAFHANGQVHIEISDDGKGVDPVRVKRKAVSSGLISEREAAALSDKEAVLLICHPGFSTAEAVTNISGRGVGMDVVKTSVEKIGGILDLHSELGKGTVMKIRIPLTLAIVPGVIVASRGERFVLPQRNLIELLRVERGAQSSPIEMVNETPVLHWRGEILPVVDLGDLLNLQHPDSDVVYIAVLQGEEQYFGLLLDQVEDTQEIVVKPLDPELKSLACFAGASVLGDGEVCLILDVSGILRQAGLDAASNPLRLQQAEDASTSSDLTLLCEIGTSSTVAISLTHLDRLEEVPRRLLEYAGGRLVMQYRGGILPLVKLNEALGMEECYSEESDNFALLVFRRRGHSVGFVVRKVLDIVPQASGEVRSPESLISYSTIISGKTVDVLNCRALLEQFDCGWFEDEQESLQSEFIAEEELLHV